ncbi:type II secretion system F family protein [Athalassotoga saccharophila]|uniref:type II secretion system F family protein n=1 Tax=Athalassotoga saccharophila TaxID=1441386 RepID=UPI0013797330|nr:type II secretion system F family protein [Athalassotoga saccharophila]BBJ28297.1 type IV fimbrial assembly protein PilC [Athalassotoga saccharophila]
MPLYVYRVITPNGKPATGRLEAESEISLVSKLSQQGYIVLGVKPTKERKRRITLRAKLADLVLFTRQLATMINAGVRIRDALTLLSKQNAFTPSFRKILVNVLVSIDSGSSLSEAIEETNAFEPIFVNLVRAGESGGVLDNTLNKVSEFYEHVKKTRDEVRSAMAYPLFVSIFAFFILMIISLFILPSLFRAFGGAKVGGIVAMLMGANDFLAANWFYATIIVVSILIFLIYFFRTSYGAATKEFVGNLIPPIKALKHLQDSSNFSKTLSTLISSGVSIIEAVDMAARATGSRRLMKKVPVMVDILKNGGTLKSAMEKTKFFPQLLVEMVGTGEETGRVDEMLSKVSEFYDQEASVKLKQLVSMIEPAMIAIIGLFVGILVFSLYQTMFNLEQGVGQHF